MPLPPKNLNLKLSAQKAEIGKPKLISKPNLRQPIELLDDESDQDDSKPAPIAVKKPFQPPPKKPAINIEQVSGP